MDGGPIRLQQTLVVNYVGDGTATAYHKGVFPVRQLPIRRLPIRRRDLVKPETIEERRNGKWESNGRCVTQSTQHRCCIIYALSNTTTELAVTMKSQAYRLAVVLQPSPRFYLGFIFWEGDEFKRTTRLSS